MGLPIRPARLAARMVGGVRPAGRTPDSFRAGRRPADRDRPSPAGRQLTPAHRGRGCLRSSGCRGGPEAESGILRNPPGLCEPRGRDPDRPRAGPARFGRHDGAGAARPRARVAGCERNRRASCSRPTCRPPGRNTWIGCPASSATKSDASSDGWSKASRSRFEWWAAAGRSTPAWKIF